MAKPKLTLQDFERASRKLRCSVPAIRAVADVESAGDGFYADGFPKILFERHLFRRFTQGRYNQSHPHLSGAQGGYGKAGQNQRNKFNEAFALNPTAAMKSCSWGKFQILGSNHKICGFDTVDEFVDAMKESEGRQLDAFVGFVQTNNLDDALRNLDWAAFAKGYNGPAYKKNKYDTKMANAYARFLKSPMPDIAPSNSAVSGTALIQDGSDADIPPAKSENIANQSSANETGHTTQVAETIVNQGDGQAVATETQEISAPAKEGSVNKSTALTVAGFAVPPVLIGAVKSFSDLVEKGYIDAKELGSLVMGTVMNNLPYVFGLIALVIVMMLAKKLCKQVTLWIQMYFAGQTNKNNVVVKPQ